MKIRILRLVGCTALALPGLAYAALGEHVSTINSDKVKMRASSRPGIAKSNYTVHEIATPSGTLVREYVSANGIVFAVAWEGPTMPDVRSLLGTYFERYAHAARTNSAGHRHAMLNDSAVVVHSSGHLRAFQGNAYLPQLLPQDVTADELQ